MTDFARGKVLLRLVDAARKEKERFDKTRNKIEEYDYGDAMTDYTSWDPDLSFRAKVYKTQQFKREIGSRLYNNNPHSIVTVRDWAPQEAQIRAKIGEDYLNYIPQENHMARDIRAVVNDALGPGRGVVWYGLHKTKSNVVVGAHDSIDTLLCDPDATKWHDQGYVIRVRQKPKWWMIQQWPDKKHIIASLDSGKKKTDVSEASENHDGSSTDIVTYYEVYMRVGLHNYAGSLTEETIDKINGDDEPKMYIVADYNSAGVILEEGDWPIPFHLDDEFPCQPLDFYDHPKSVWPISPLEPGIGWQEAINWVSTMIVAKFKSSSRLLMALVEANGVKLDQDAVEKVVYGELPVDVFRLKATAASSGDMVDVNKYLQQVQLSANIGEALDLLTHLNREFEMATGLYEFLYHGQQGGVDRSAQASSIRDRNTRTRIDDMQSRIDDFLSKDARMKMLAARYLLDGEDIAPLLGPEAGQAWGFLMPAEKLTPGYWRSKYMDEGYMPEVADELAAEMTQGAVSLEQWLQETDYTIEVGSTQRKSPEAKSDALKEAHNQWVPAMLQHGATNAAAGLGAEWAKDMGLDDETVQLIRSFPAEILQMQQMMAEQQAAAQPPPEAN